MASTMCESQILSNKVFPIKQDEDVRYTIRHIIAEKRVYVFVKKVRNADWFID